MPVGLFLLVPLFAPGSYPIGSAHHDRVGRWRVTIPFCTLTTEYGTFPSAPRRTGLEPFNSSGSPVIHHSSEGGVSGAALDGCPCGTNDRPPGFCDGVQPLF